MPKKPPPPPPFSRNPRKLGFVIGVASAVLVAAGAAAIMLNSAGDFDTVPHIKRVTATPSSGEPTVPPHAPVTAATSTSATTSETPSPDSSAPRRSEAPAPSRSVTPTPVSPRPSTRNPNSFHPTPIPTR